MAQIRTINSAWAELHRIDPETCVSQAFIRELVVTGKIPSLRSGNRHLLNMDHLNHFLALHFEESIGGQS